MNLFQSRIEVASIPLYYPIKQHFTWANFLGYTYKIDGMLLETTTQGKKKQIFSLWDLKKSFLF